MKHTEYFEKNMKALKAQDELLYEAICEYDSTQPQYCPEIVQAKDGTEITKIVKDGKEWFLNSQYRPLQEATTFVEQYSQVIDYSFMVFLGFGNGMLARQLHQSMGEHVVLLFFEPSVEIFLHTMQHYDISDLFAAENLFITVEELNKEKVPEILTAHIQFDTYRNAIYDALPKYRQLFPEKNLWLEDFYRQGVMNVRVYLDTQQAFGKSFAINNIQNMKHLLNCNYRDDFKDVFPHDIPAVVVAAGPSLEKNIEVLKKMKGKALIVAVDTALRYLTEQGMKPDLGITVDAEKPIRLFDTEKIRELTLVIDSGSNYRAADLLSRHKLIFSGGNYVYYKKVFKINRRNFEFLKNGGSVATVAFSLLREWGVQRIILVGQDLALAPDKVHAGNDDVDLHKLDSDKIAIEGYYGNIVYTTWDYDAYRKWFEEVIEEEDCPEVINATEGGARIKGAIQMPLQKVLDTYCTREFDFEKAIEDVPIVFTEKDRPQLLALWEESVKNLGKLKRNFKEGIRLVEEEIRLITRKHYSKGNMRDIHRRLDKIFKECDSYMEIQLVDSMIAAEEEKILDDLYEMKESNDEEHCRLLEKLKKYLASMLEATDEVKELYVSVINQVQVE